MSLKLPLVNTDHISPSKKKTQVTASQQEGGNFEPITVDLESSLLSPEAIALIRNGDGIEKYANDRSRALLAACNFMCSAEFSDQKILSVLTDPTNYLSGAAYDRRGPDRQKAMAWIAEYTLAKARESFNARKSPAGGFFSKEGLINRGEEITAYKLGLTFVSFAEIKIAPDVIALVEGLIDQGASILAYGATNVGKTFAILGLALHVSAGTPFLGRKVQKGAVLYIATESGGGAQKRVAAFRKAHGLEGKELPFRLAYGTVDLLNSKNETAALVQEVKNTETIFGVRVRLVVIDTLGRAIPGGDENTAPVMSALIRSVDLIRQETGATVILVHHEGKEESRGARGHSSLKAAVDTELRISACKSSDTKKISVTKQRERDYCPDLYYKLVPHEVGQEENGAPITSCVIAHEIDPAVVFGPKPLKGRTKDALATLQTLISEKGISPPAGLGWLAKERISSVRAWRRTFAEQYYPGKSRQSSHSAFLGAKVELLNAGRIEIHSDGDSVRILQV